MKPSVSVIYLCYTPYGLQSFNDFIQSYLRFEAGIKHNLIIIFKGHELLSNTEPFVSVLQQYHIVFQQLVYTGSELDIGTYFWAAEQMDCLSIFFLNSRSVILVPNWLQIFHTAANANPGKIFSATGSWQSLVTTIFLFNKADALIRKPFSLKAVLIKVRSQVEAATMWWYYFPLFPNPHIRTNAFYIDRQLFLSFRKTAIVNKMQAFKFESGRKGFSACLKKRGFKLAILSKTGAYYLEDKWPESEIFYVSDQKNLIIEDNQTKAYKNPLEQKRSFLRKIVWG